MNKALVGALLGASMLASAALARPAPARPAQTAAANPVRGNARARADAIVRQMTFDEKIALVHGLFPPMAAGKTTADLIQAACHIDGVPRICVPLVLESDA